MSSCPSEVVGVWVVFPDPSSISFCTTLFQRAETEEELNAKLTRRVQRAARRQAKQEELRRLHRAQVRVTCFEACLFMCLLFIFMYVISDYPASVGAGGGQAEAAGGEGCSCGESTQRRSRYLSII